MIIAGIHNKSSLQEMADKIGKSISTVQARLKILMGLGLVSPPFEPNQKRAYTLTERGERLFDTYQTQVPK